MTNLLPAEDKKIIKKEFLRRFIVVAGVGLLIITSVGTILPLATLFYTNSFARSLNDQLIITKNIAKSSNLEELEIQTNEINMLLTTLQNNGKTTQSISNNMLKIIEIAPLFIKMDAFLFNVEGDAPEIVINGHAATRNALLSFIENLKSSKFFEEITSPVSNLLAKKDVDFSLRIKLKNE